MKESIDRIYNQMLDNLHLSSRNLFMTPHQKNDVPYNQIDHDHCWRSKNPPCGQKIEHLKCCLCEKLNPRIETLLTQQAERIAEEVGGIAGVFAEDEKGNDILLIKKSDAVTIIRKLRSEVTDNK